MGVPQGVVAAEEVGGTVGVEGVGADTVGVVVEVTKKR